MLNYTEAVKQVCKVEEDLSLYDQHIGGISIWRAIRTNYRKRYVTKLSGVKSVMPRIVFHKSKLWPQLSSYFISLFGYLKLLVNSPKIDSVLFGFKRLETIDGFYVDKFLEPLVENSTLKDNYLYLDQGRRGVHKSPRIVKNILFSDFIEKSQRIFSYVLSPFVLISHYDSFKKTYEKSKKDFGLAKKDLFNFALSFSYFLVGKFLIYHLLKSVKAKRIIGPALNLNYSAISAAKKLGIKSIEIQHGITTDLSITYSGKYDPQFAVDEFYVFGESSMIPQFGVPKQNMYNIGSAFKSWVEKIHQKIERNHKYLLLSDPEITKQMIDTAIDFKHHFPNYDFSIRFHPAERINESQKELLKKESINIDDNSINSTLSSTRYEGVIGLCTSVLYEAVSVGTKAACIDFDNFSAKFYPNPPSEEHFFYIKNIEDFSNFIDYIPNLESRKLFYSDFNRELFESLINK